MGIISFRTYLFVGLIIGAILFAGNYFFGEDVVRWATTQDNKAIQADLEPLGTLVMEPLKFVFNPDQSPFGAIVAALFWPLTILWPFLILLHLLVVAGMGVANETPINTSIWRPYI